MYGVCRLLASQGSYDISLQALCPLRTLMPKVQSDGRVNAQTCMVELMTQVRDAHSSCIRTLILQAAHQSAPVTTPAVQNTFEGQENLASFSL